MNCCEKMLIEKMNLRAGRGRSMEYLVKCALREMREERNHMEHRFKVVVYSTVLGMRGWEYFATLKEARFEMLRLCTLNKKEWAETLGDMFVCVGDCRTGIRIYSAQPVKEGDKYRIDILNA